MHTTLFEIEHFGWTPVSTEKQTNMRLSICCQTKSKRESKTNSCYVRKITGRNVTLQRVHETLLLLTFLRCISQHYHSEYLITHLRHVCKKHRETFSWRLILSGAPE